MVSRAHSWEKGVEPRITCWVMGFCLVPPMWLGLAIGPPCCVRPNTQSPYKAQLLLAKGCSRALSLEGDREAVIGPP